ncbi:ABC transporter permease [Microbacterium alcoholitolerans]|uniref:ABC transporter permease n=1 Tax=unclassified Microbacterium TaxID=2609290 RepID=UPI003D17754E
MTIKRLILGAVGFLLILAIWQWAASGPLSDGPLPTAAATLSELLALLPTAEFWGSVWLTVQVALGGFLIALVAGVALGIGTASSRVTMHATRAVLEFLKPIPPIVILPLVVLVLGPTMDMGIFLVFFGCLLPVLMQTAAGVLDVDPVALATGRSFSMGRGEILRRIVLPSAMPHIGTAIRLSVPTSLVTAVVAGLLGGGPGLGNSLIKAQLSGSQELLFAYVIALGLLGLVFQAVSDGIESRVLRWHPSYRKAVH